ncbi:MAG: DUF2239 family protein [Pseudolabrys sp.]
MARSTARHDTAAIAFEGHRRIAEGALADVALKAKKAADRSDSGPVLLFNSETSEPIEVDFRGTGKDVLARLTTPTGSAPAPVADAPRGPGRPKLGVVPREVTLLPRHWDWLNAQPGGASVALRKLVEDARKTSGTRDRTRARQEAAYRFMSAMAGNMSDFDEAARALFAGDSAKLEQLTAPWAKDVRAHVLKLAAAIG